jgi:glycosyltransferase involved in cell wall biosynthesis
MRLLIGMPDPGSLGGPATCEPPFVAELRKQSVEVEEEAYVYGEKLSRTSLSRRVKRVLASAYRLRRKLRSGSFDLLHLNTAFDPRALLRDVVTLAVLGRQRTRIFIKFHGSDADLFLTSRPLLKMLVHSLLSRADGIGVLSTEEKQNFTGAGWDEKKIFVVKNVVERTFPARTASFNSQNRLPEGLPTLLFIARFIPAKGLLDVIRACAVLRDQGMRFALLCVGDGPARAAAEAETEKLNLVEHTRFLGLLPEDQTAEFYTNSTMLVFPTYHFEGFPMAVFYAVAAGIPIITTRIRGAADYLVEPSNCLWVEPRNPAMLAEKIAFLLNSSAARSAMGEANRRLARQFSAEVVTREYLQAYQSVIDRVD